MKYLIAGLGNIGPEYNQTRHNIGFDVIDCLAKELNAEFSLQKLAIVSEVRLKNKQLVIIKPTTFMNLSGKAVRYYLELHKIPLENLLVVTDDLALDVGVIRIRQKGSHGGHNGLRNIEEIMQTQQYSRMRFGIGNQFHKSQQIDFVLGKWKADEEIAVNNQIIKASQAIQAFVLEGASKAMTSYNG
ncbi:MAG: aminoacyl-tRNA hydrolase [Bacteroidetes bacterium]|nr:aminoacyl-tRNA hydrolase [Bacteroidota bacterium]